MWQILYYQGSWPWRTHRVSHIPTMATQHSCHLYSLAIDAQICPLQEWDETWMMSYDWFRPIMTFPFPCFQVFFGSLPIQFRASQWALREKYMFFKDLVVTGPVPFHPFPALYRSSKVEKLWRRHESWGYLAEIKQPWAYGICDHLNEWFISLFLSWLLSQPHPRGGLYS